MHSWEVSPKEAIEIQKRLASLVSHRDGLAGMPRYVAGVDISAEDSQGYATGAVVVLDFPGLQVAEVKASTGRPGFPYVPGLLSFRETPLILAAFEKLTVAPDLLLVDGQGLAHPRRFGIACHLGLLLDIPTVGCAKSILRGRHGPLPTEVGASAELVDKGEVVGAAVRSRAGVSPIYVSVGHKIDLAEAIRWTLACCQGYRMPEPTRLAHQAAAGRLEEMEPESRTPVILGRPL